MLTLLLSIILIGSRAEASYRARCNGSDISLATINSVFGEPRPLTDPMTRFHGGVDINQCPANATVEAIYGGTVTLSGVTSCTDGTCIRVTDSKTHAFEYEHLGQIFVSSGFVPAGTTLGTVDIDEVLHLQETFVIGLAGYRANPLRLGALDFDHSSLSPAFSTPDPTYTTPNSIVLAPVYIGGPDGSRASVTPFAYRDGIYFVSGDADVLVTGRSRPVAASRAGLYVVGFDIEPRSARTQLFRYDITFNYMKDGATDLSDFQTIYGARNSSGFTHFATNIKADPIGGPETFEQLWDTTNESDGIHAVCGRIQDFPQGHVDNTCASVFVDNTPPSTTLLANGSTFTGATQYSTVTVQGDDAGGIDHIDLDGVTVVYSSHHYVTGVQNSASNVFPDIGVLADGQYKAVVYDLAGNASAPVSFTIDTANPPASNQNADGVPLPILITSTNCVVIPASAPSGISSINLTGPDGFSS
ncbi:MAG: M23 family metallopeptidase, partial [Elusimicrobia bacterium]|nr:M23 family metallopeptidase [Elusimicrobiota bacterium]